MARHDEGFFTAKDNLRIFWETDLPETPKAHVGVVHGYMDHSGRFRKVIDALVADGYAVHALDLRGHGQSDGRRSHCDSFQEYIDDLDLFWTRVRKAAGSKKSFLLAHSFGGLVSTMWLAQKNPEGVAGLVLSSPFYDFGFKPPAVKVQVSKAIGKFIPWLPVKHTLNPAELTRDPELQRAVDKDPLYNRVATPRWFTECVQAHTMARTVGNSIKVPTFMLSGSADTVALPAAMRAFFETVGATDKKFKEYSGMVHEVMNDVGKEEVWRDISNWISAHL